jgi:hypothetical protein
MNKMYKKALKIEGRKFSIIRQEETIKIDKNLLTI